MCYAPILFVFETPASTQLHPSSKPKKVTTCFVLDDCGDNFDTFVNTAGGKVSFSMESTRQTPSTPTAPIAVDTRRQNVLDVHATDDDDESWSSEDHHKSGWNTRFNGGTYRGMLFGVDCKIIRGKLCHLSGQETCQQTCVNFSLGHKITITLTRRLRLYSAKQTSRPLLFRVLVDAKSSLAKYGKSNSSDQRARFVTPF